MSENTKEWIRGVNIGGWLLAERFIVPYLFAVNSCHMERSLCVYPGQMGLDDGDNEICDPQVCEPMLKIAEKQPTDYHLDPRLPGSELGTENGMTYPVDEYTLGLVLRSSPGGIETATRYMERHWETFVTYEDLKTLKENGVTHVRIPMGYWIRGIEGLSIIEGEPYIPGGWKYFVRVANWCRELGLTVWADLHGAPGSENGFDNSGQYLGTSICAGWSGDRVQRTLDILTDMANAIIEDGIDDVVTGFGVLNEPFNCDPNILRKYNNDALDMLRTTLGEDTAVFVGDHFSPWTFNDGQFWLDPDIYHDTYMDSHPYHVFFEQGRSFTPRQHIAFVCRHDSEQAIDCCYEDAGRKQIPSKGISRVTGEWSLAYDVLPTALTPQLMKGIATNGVAPLLNRTLSVPRMEFLRNYAEAQMVAYEAADSGGISSGWLFWNFKMEGGAFAEWDFLRGLKEGWMPPIPEPHVSSESLYGTCYDILNKTDDSYAIVDEYPDPRTLDWSYWQGTMYNDDLVMSDPYKPFIDRSLMDPDAMDPISIDDPLIEAHSHHTSFVVLACGAIVALGILHRSWQSYKNRRRVGYEELKE